MEIVKLSKDPTAKKGGLLKNAHYSPPSSKFRINSIGHR